MGINMKFLVAFSAIAAMAYAEADPYYAYGLGYAHHGYALGLKSAPCVNAANVPVPCAAGYAGHYLHAYGKRDAELRLRLIPTTDTDTTDWDTTDWDTLVSDTLVSDTLVSDTMMGDTLVSDTMVLDTMPTERGRLMLMLRPMPLSFTPDTDIPPTDTPDSDTPVSDTPTTVLLLLPLLLPLLPLLLLPSPPSTTPFSEPRLCPTLCTLWLTPGTEPSCTPAISECAPTTWASRCPARKSSGGHGVCCEESNLENWWKCVT